MVPLNRHALLTAVRGLTLGLAFAAMYVVGPLGLRGFHVQVAWGLLGSFFLGLVVPRAFQVRPIVPLLWLTADVIAVGVVGMYLRVPDARMLPESAAGALTPEASLAFLSGFLIAVLVAVMGRRVYAGALGLLAGGMLLLLGEATVSHAPASALEEAARITVAPGPTDPKHPLDPVAEAKLRRERVQILDAARSVASDPSGPPASRDLYLWLRVMLVGLAAIECGFITSRIDAEDSRRRTAASLGREMQARETIAKVMAAFAETCGTAGSVAELGDALVLHLRKNFPTTMRAVALEDANGCVAIWEEGGSLDDPLAAKRRARLQAALREVGSNLVPERLETRSLGGPPGARAERLLTNIAVPVLASGHVAGVLFLGDTRRETVGSDRIGALAELARATGDALRRIERSRDEQTRRTSLLLGQMREGILLVGPEGGAVLHNAAGREMLRSLGLSTKGPFALGEIQAAQLAAVPAGTVRRTHASATAPDGRTLRFAVVAMGVVDGGARLGTLVTMSDVTDEERGRRRLLQAEKMSFVGQTLASVAHELNNPLAAIVAYADLLAESPVSPDVGQLLQRIREQATRTSRIVRNILSVARRRGPERTHASLNEIATSVVELFEYDARLSNVAIQPMLDPDLPPLFVDRHAIQQILVNLVQNALHSLRSRQQGGTIEIETSWKGTLARLVVRDDGPGIPPDARGRLFEAFFTTKGPDEGTGLGLAISRGIAREHGGELALEDRSDGRSGAQFVLRLPLGERAQATTASTPKTVPEGVPAHVLVVDDEAPVRDALVAQLSRLGASVDAAAGIDDAYAHLNRTAYDVLLVDVRLHGRSGIEIHRDLVQAQSPLADRILFMTGDLVNEDVVRAVRATGRPLLEKPFTGEELRRALLAAATAT